MIIVGLPAQSSNIGSSAVNTLVPVPSSTVTAYLPDTLSTTITAATTTVSIAGTLASSSDTTSNVVSINLGTTSFVSTTNVGTVANVALTNVPTGTQASATYFVSSTSVIGLVVTTTRKVTTAKPVTTAANPIEVVFNPSDGYVIEYPPWDQDPVDTATVTTDDSAPTTTPDSTATVTPTPTDVVGGNTVLATLAGKIFGIPVYVLVASGGSIVLVLLGLTGYYLIRRRTQKKKEGRYQQKAKGKSKEDNPAPESLSAAAFGTAMLDQSASLESGTSMGTATAMATTTALSTTAMMAFNKTMVSNQKGTRFCSGVPSFIPSFLPPLIHSFLHSFIHSFIQYHFDTFTSIHSHLDSFPSGYSRIHRNVYAWFLGAIHQQGFHDGQGIDPWWRWCRVQGNRHQPGDHQVNTVGRSHRQSCV